MPEMPVGKRVGADVAVTGAGEFASLPEADEAGKGACAMFVLLPAIGLLLPAARSQGWCHPPQPLRGQLFPAWFALTGVA